MAALNTSLEYIRQWMQAREFLMRIEEHNGTYCSDCIPSSEPPDTYGPTCPLLRPNTDTSAFVLSEWYKEATRSKSRFERLEMEIARGGAGPNVVGMWEETITSLNKEVEGEPSKKRGGVLEISSQVEGLDLKWGFEEAWGKGRGEGREVAPDEIASDENRHQGDVHRGSKPSERSASIDDSDSDGGIALDHESYSNHGMDSANGSIVPFVQAGSAVRARSCEEDADVAQMGESDDCVFGDD
jgi:hypothetical protein